MTSAALDCSVNETSKGAIDPGISEMVDETVVTFA